MISYALGASDALQGVEGRKECQKVSLSERAARAPVSVLLLLMPFRSVLLQVMLLQQAAFMVLLYTDWNWPGPGGSPSTLSISPRSRALRIVDCA